MSQEIDRSFNNIFSELEILNNNISKTYNLIELLQFTKTKNICIKIYKKKKVKIVEKKINNDLELNLDLNLELENILSKSV